MKSRMSISLIPFFTVNLIDSLFMFEIGEVDVLILAGENVSFYLVGFDTQHKYIFVDGK